MKKNLRNVRKNRICGIKTTCSIFVIALAVAAVVGIAVWTKKEGKVTFKSNQNNI